MNKNIKIISLASIIAFSFSACGGSASDTVDKIMGNDSDYKYDMPKDYKAENFEKKGKIVTDKKNKLQWQDDVAITFKKPYSMLPKNTFTVDGYCSKLKLDGQGWRVPTQSEFETIFGAVKDNKFEYSFASKFWTNQQSDIHPNKKIAINFKNRTVSEESVDTEAYVRCVRDLK